MLGENAYREKVRFYEENPEAVSALEYDDRLEIDIDYVLCLFEIGRYQRFLEKVDPVIEGVIEENFYTLRRENIFHTLLLKKSASLYHCGAYQKAENILLQLMRMDEKSDVAKKLYSLCKRKKENDITTGFRVAAMSGLLVVLSITVVRILLLEPFYDQYMEPFILIRNIILCVSLISLLCIEIYHHLSFHKDTGKFPYRFIDKIFRFITGKK
jgi:tetratricopeptide (TPR) repeat protein